MADFSIALSKNAEKISTALMDGSFHFRSALGKTIPKPGKKKRRPLRVFNVGDRLVQKSILLQIQRYFPEIGLSGGNTVSFAFIREQSVKKAVDAVKHGYGLGHRYILLADIENFFENIDRDALLKEIVSRLPDDSLNDLLREAIEVDIGNRAELSPEEQNLFPTGTRGVAQGSILAPFFSNVYMIEFDHLMMRRKIYTVRYADDLAVLTQTRPEAERHHEMISEYLETQRGLSLHPLGAKKGSRIVPLSGGFDYLGILFRRQKGTWHLEPSEAKQREMEDEVRRWTTTTKNWPLMDRLVVLSRKFEGWIRCYRPVCSIAKLVRRLDRLFAERILALLISRRLVGPRTRLTPRQCKFLGIQRSIRRGKRVVLLPEGIFGVRRSGR